MNNCFARSSGHLLLPLLLVSYGLFGQASDTLETTQDDLALSAKYYGDSVVLRWMPVDAYFWKEANQIGYTITRMELTGDSLATPEQPVSLNERPIKPWPLEDWEALSERNDAAAVAAMALYGEDIQNEGAVDPTQQGLYAVLKAQQQDRNNRHFFASLAADQSAEAADALGLRWVDENITPGRTYIYWIELADSTGSVQLEKSGIAVTTDEVITPVPMDISTRTVENGVRVIWDKPINQMFFAGYHIERATQEEGPYERLNAELFIKVNSDLENDTTGIITYLDTLAVPYRPYYYRVVGLDFFGDMSPASEVVEGMRRDIDAPGSPVIFPAQFNEQGHVQLQWHKEVEEPDFAGFYVARSPFNDGPFTRIHPDLLPFEQRNYLDTSTTHTDQYYYRIEAVDTARNRSLSLSAFVFAYDSVAPPAPVQLVGDMDSLGHVTLHWPAVPVSDLRGYRLFRANAADHRFMQVNRAEIMDTVYVDTISLKTVTKHIYYRLAAYDANFNTSPLSETLELERYDIIPPAPSVLYDYELGEGEVSLSWYGSASEDVVEQLLYRQQGDQEWVVFARLDTTVTSYTDSTLLSNTFYRYALGTVDQSGLMSSRSPAIGIKTRAVNSEDEIQNIEVQYDDEAGQVELSWDYAGAATDHRYLIYRAYDDSGLQSYTTLPSDAQVFTDTAVRQKGDYQYAIRVVYPDGRKSRLSATVQNTIP